MRKLPVVLAAVWLSACSGDKDPLPPGGTTTHPGGNPVDRDGDGFGIPGDCDDNDPTVHPTADDPPYDGIDSNCRGDSDFDADQDGFLWSGTEGGDDCDDNNAEVHPGVDEVCNGIDDDCDGTTDGEGAEGSIAYYPDNDGDGTGKAADVIYACEQPPETVELPGDCDDDDPTVWPGAPAIACDGVDNDCNPDTLEPSGALLGGGVELDLLVAVSQAAPGDVLTLCEGRVAVNALIIDKSLTLQGMGSALTVLDGEGNDSILEVGTTAPVTLQGFTVTGGIGKVVGNERLGGGLWMGPGSNVAGDDLRFEENRAGRGGAIWLGADASLTLTNSTLFSNRGDPASAVVDSGGAIASEEGGQLLFDAVTVEANEASRCGGLELLGGTLLEGNATTEIIENETRGLAGGGLCADGSTLRDLVIARNLSPNASGGLDGRDVTLENIQFTENIADLTGGGASLYGTIEISGCTFASNVAFDGGGFALFAPESAVRVVDSVFTNNQTTFVGALGGGAVLDQASLVSENTDWGSGATDNAPSDVFLLQNNESYGYNGIASFSCNDVPGSGTCE